MLGVGVLKVIATFAAIELFLIGGLGALAAVRLGFPYAALSPVSSLIYGFAGYFAVRAGGSGAMAGVVVACLDSVTWAAFGGFGPQPTLPNATVSGKIGVVVFVTLLGALCGLAGGWFAARSATPAGG
jgi:hypothetical protein